MPLARHAIAVSVVVALVLAVLFGAAVTQRDRLDKAHLSGGACAGFSAPDGSRSMTVTIPVHNTSSSPVRIDGIRAGKRVGRGSVRFRVIVGRHFHLNEFGSLGSFRHQAHVVDALGATLPAHRWSTILVTMTVGPGSSRIAINDVQVSYRGRLDTMRTERLQAALGVMAPGRATCDISAVMR